MYTIRCCVWRLVRLRALHLARLLQLHPGVLQAAGGAELVHQVGQSHGVSKRNRADFEPILSERLALSSVSSTELAVCFLDLADLSCEERFKARL